MPYADPEKKKQYMREWYKKNTAHMQLYRKATKGRRREIHSAWRKAHLPERAAAQLKYRQKFPGASQVRSRIANILRGRHKPASTIDLLGCEWTAFFWYLEAQFKPGMTWENYGSIWEIDHIVPISWFDQSEIGWEFRAFHFSNCQPLEVSENRKKGNRYVL